MPTETCIFLNRVSNFYCKLQPLVLTFLLPAVCRRNTLGTNKQRDGNTLLCTNPVYTHLVFTLLDSFPGVKWYDTGLQVFICLYTVIANIKHFLCFSRWLNMLVKLWDCVWLIKGRKIINLERNFSTRVPAISSG